MDHVRVIPPEGSSKAERPRRNSRPRVTFRMRPSYLVEWEFEARVWPEGINEDFWEGRLDTNETFTQKHRKEYRSRWHAYRHAAWSYIIDRRRQVGCTTRKNEGQCRTGEDPPTYHGWDDSWSPDKRCKYCAWKSVHKIVDRLTRWLIWRDKRRAEIGDGR